MKTTNSITILVTLFCLSCENHFPLEPLKNITGKLYNNYNIGDSLISNSNPKLKRNEILSNYKNIIDKYGYPKKDSVERYFGVDNPKLYGAIFRLEFEKAYGPMMLFIIWEDNKWKIYNLLITEDKFKNKTK